MSDLGWSRYTDILTESAVSACVEAAEESGHTATEAELCENGSLKCNSCPWRKTE